MNVYWKKMFLSVVIAVGVALITQNIILSVAVLLLLLIASWAPTYIPYAHDNPQHLWFKRKLFGWGLTPVTWQGWIVVAVGVAVVGIGVYIANVDNAPGAALLGALLMIVMLVSFGFWKGEKPKWK